MKTLCIALSVLLLGISYNYSYADDLDAPASKKITVRSELKRGSSAAKQCDSYFYNEIRRYTRCIDDIILTNEQKNTDTDSFILGANLGAWICIYMTLEESQLKQSEGNLLWNHRESAVAAYYSEFRKRQAKLKLTDRTIIEEIGYKFDGINNMMSEYGNKNK